MKKISTKHFKVGIIVIGALFLLYFGLNFLKGINIFSSVNQYYAQYEDLGGLVVSSPVYVRGYKVGQVDEIAYDFKNNKPFTIRFSVSDDIEMPEGTKINLFDDGLLGGKAIQLELPATGSGGKSHTEGDTINSQVINGLFDELAGLMPKIQSMSTQADSLITSVRNIIEDESISNSLNSIEKTTADLSVATAKLKNIMQSDVPGLINNTNNFITDLSVISGNIKGIDFAHTVSSLDSTIGNLHDVSKQLNDKNGTLGLLLNDKDLYYNLASVSMNADSLLIDLKKNPKRYVHFSIFGRNK